jgi:hypothetical protein
MRFVIGIGKMQAIAKDAAWPGSFCLAWGAVGMPEQGMGHGWRERLRVARLDRRRDAASLEAANTSGEYAAKKGAQKPQKTISAQLAARLAANQLSS